ncbi:MAG: DVU3141 family protein [Granulosicoccus sp.]
MKYPAVTFVVLPILLALQSCAVSSPKAMDALQTVASVSVHEAPEMNSLNEGDSVVFYDGILAPFGQVTIGRVYTAASGRVCKRIHNAKGDELLSVACQTQKDHWYMRNLP